MIDFNFTVRCFNNLIKKNKKLFACLMIFISTTSFAAEKKNIKILTETSDIYSVEDVINKYSNKFEDYSSQYKSLTEKTLSYWLKFDYINPDLSQHVLFSSFIYYQKIELFYYENDILKHQITGSNVNIKNRSIKSRFNYILMPFTQKQTTCYVHIINNEGYSDKLFLETYFNYSTSMLSLTALEMYLYGFLAISFFISFVMYLLDKEKIYLIYCLHLILLFLSLSFNNGYVCAYLSPSIFFESLEKILHIYSTINTAITCTIIIYFYYYWNLSNSKSWFKILLPSLLVARLLLWIIYILFIKQKNTFFDGTELNLFFLVILLVVAIKQCQKQINIGLISIFGIFILILGNQVLHKNIEIETISPYTAFVFINSFQVISFLLSIAYRSSLIKKENQLSNLKLIEQLRENERIKNEINIELETKVLERTEQIKQQSEEIAKMNELLKLHNIELLHEVEDISKARVLQKSMSFKEFTKLFNSDESCLQYLSEIKWNSNTKYKCGNCGFLEYSLLTNLSRKCKKCNYLESPTAGTLFHKLKFSLQKAFYITYSTSMSNSEYTIEVKAKEIDLRVATYWSFKQKVIKLIEKNKSRKKHKDGWTHLIEYSIDSY